MDDFGWKKRVQVGEPWRDEAEIIYSEEALSGWADNHLNSPVEGGLCIAEVLLSPMCFCGFDIYAQCSELSQLN